ncbi:hypothetical protein H0H81_001390 [Sphagnurus paluster]|uniref:FYVE-type domain-containing protein n=1 Tax=Sphagnurus paluster TaxID=117069 RepID=A0A9P7K5W6_9AGAR|nr:hypothetical protein H0H81_001390 [Sphagnurus paluster]
MSALTASRPSPPAIPHPQPIPDIDTDTDPVPTTPPSPASCYSSLPSLTHSSPSSSSSSIHSVQERSNEHLAVLLPKHLWKHCRKCGGVFCASCTSRTTPLLDSSNLDFINPPRNTPLATFASPTSPLQDSRVCDDCYDQVRGHPATPRTPDLVRPSLARLLSSPISMLNSPLSTSGPSSLASSIDAPSHDPHPLAKSDSRSLLATAAPLARRSRTRSLRTTPSISSLSAAPAPRRASIRPAHITLPPDLERSYGELDAYPLRRSSILCKATGGGRWEPKQEPALIGTRPPVPGAKAPYELDMERQARAERARTESRLVRDGDFQYRIPCAQDPLVLLDTPFAAVSTF